jgi:hypothetical protein
MDRVRRCIEMMAWYWHAHQGGSVAVALDLVDGAVLGRPAGDRAVLHSASPTSASAGPSAEDLLDERYARGEIDDEE